MGILFSRGREYRNTVARSRTCGADVSIKYFLPVKIRYLGSETRNRGTQISTLRDRERKKGGGNGRDASTWIRSWIRMSDGTRPLDGYCECFILYLCPHGHRRVTFSEDNSGLLSLANVKSDVTSVRYLAPHRNYLTSRMSRRETF